MRTKVLSHRIGAALKLSSIGILGGVIAGCSSGMQRFDTSVYSSAVPQDTNYSSNPYPGDVDRTTTAGINKRVEPYSTVGPRPVPQGVYHRNEPTYAAAQPYANNSNHGYRQPLNTYQPQTAQTNYGAASQGWQGNSSVTRTDLPKPSASYTPPKPDNNTVYIAPSGSDRMTTASVPASSSTPRKGGWTQTGGTVIQVRSGETLYNLSKRFGVPVSAIRQANGMSSADTLKAGQNLTIPNYVFSSSSPVSAPDSDPKTRAARATTGYIGEASPNRASVPEKRPFETAAVSPSGNTQDKSRERYSPKSRVSPPIEYKTPDYGVVTGSVSGNGGTYKVVSGDSLSKIAKMHGTTVSQLQKANRMNTTVIRVGQTLAIPGGSNIDYTRTASVSVSNPGVDPIVTGSTGNAKSTSSNKTVETPASSGISQFRWPVKGRVVSSFGDVQSNGKNEGIDIAVPEGTAVRSVENGVVIYAGEEISMYGKLVLVRHADDWVSAYAHNREFEVEKGDVVRRGQIIARSGKTGSTDRPKLHFELRKKSNPVDPQKYLAGA